MAEQNQIILTNTIEKTINNNNNTTVQYEQYGYLECKKKGLHIGECLNYVCFDQNCAKNGPICCICKCQDHQNHKVLPQKYFLYQLQDRLQHIFPKNNSENSNNEEEMNFLSMGFNLQSESDLGANQEEEKTEQKVEKVESIQENKEESVKLLDEAQKSQQKQAEIEQKKIEDKKIAEQKYIKQMEERQIEKNKIIQQIDQKHEQHIKSIDKLQDKIARLRNQIVQTYETTKQRIESQSKGSERFIKELLKDFVIPDNSALQSKNQSSTTSPEKNNQNKADNNKSEQQKHINLKKFDIKSSDESNNNSQDNEKIYNDYIDKWTDIATLVTEKYDQLELCLDFNLTYNNYSLFDRQIKQLLDQEIKTSETATIKLDRICKDCKIKPIYKHIAQQKEENVQQVGGLQFSTTLKSKYIKLSEDNMVATQSSTSNEEKRFAISNIPLPNNQISKFVIEVVKKTNWVGVGIGLKNVLLKKDFKFEYQKTGMGYYIMSANGYSWSHSKESDHIKSQQLQFVEGDKVSCQYNPTAKTLSLYNNTNKKSFIFTDILIPPSESVHILIGMSNKDEKVRLLPQTANSTYTFI